MSDQEFVEQYGAEVQQVIAELDFQRLAETLTWLREARDTGNTIYMCGNGGSGAIASEMVVDMMKGASLGKKRRFKAVSLVDNVPTLTAYANDIGYDAVFVEPLKNVAQAGDILIAISGSGNSTNVLRAVEYANMIGCRTVALTTSQGGKLKDIASLVLSVPTSHMGYLEDCFNIMTHMLSYALMDYKIEGKAVAVASTKERWQK